MYESIEPGTRQDPPFSEANPIELSSLPQKLNDYLEECHTLSADASKRKSDSFPNLAGFCRYIGCGMTALEGLRLSNPTVYDYICAIFEDEALNAEISPTILTAYLKRRLGYAEKGEASAVADCGEVRLIFEHDVLEDGA